MIWLAWYSTGIYCTGQNYQNGKQEYFRFVVATSFRYDLFLGNIQRFDTKYTDPCLRPCTHFVLGKFGIGAVLLLVFFLIAYKVSLI